MTATALGTPIRHLASVASTMDEAARWAAEGAPDGAVVVAERQHGGRGRHGRVWASAPGQSLLLTVVLRPSLPAERIGLIPLAAGLAVAERVFEAVDPALQVTWTAATPHRAPNAASLHWSFVMTASASFTAEFSSTWLTKSLVQHEGSGVPCASWLAARHGLLATSGRLVSGHVSKLTSFRMSSSVPRRRATHF